MFIVLLSMKVKSGLTKEPPLLANLKKELLQYFPYSLVTVVSASDTVLEKASSITTPNNFCASGL